MPLFVKEWAQNIHSLTRAGKVHLLVKFKLVKFSPYQREIPAETSGDAEEAAGAATGFGRYKGKQ